MKNVIIYTGKNGGVSVCYPSGELSLEEVLAKDIPAGVQSYVVDYDTLPTGDNDFFDAWKLSGGTVTVDLTKAKALTKDRLRAERAPLLAAQDIAFQRAQETGADTTAIVAEKQRLRNITTLVDACTSTTQLRALHC
jgi:hypothetical protein